MSGCGTGDHGEAVGAGGAVRWAPAAGVPEAGRDGGSAWWAAGGRWANGRQWSLPLADRVLLVATYYCNNLTMRQLAPPFGEKTAAVHGSSIDRSVPGVSPSRRRYGPETVLIVDGTLVPTRDRAVAASSKNYRISVNMQVMIDAATRLVVA